jgi:hypothetical protein
MNLEDAISFEEQLKELEAETNEKLSKLSSKNIQLERGILKIIRLLGE